MDIIDQTTDENALADIVFYNRIVNGPSMDNGHLMVKEKEEKY